MCCDIDHNGHPLAHSLQHCEAMLNRSFQVSRVTRRSHHPPPSACLWGDHSWPRRGCLATPCSMQNTPPQLPSCDLYHCIPSCRLLVGPLAASPQPQARKQVLQSVGWHIPQSMPCRKPIQPASHCHSPTRTNNEWYLAKFGTFIRSGNLCVREDSW